MRKLVFIGIGLLTFAVGCGSDGEGPQLSDEEQVAEVIAKMNAALARGDGEEACSYMTKEGQQIYMTFAKQFKGSQPETCEEAVRDLVVSPSELPKDARAVTEEFSNADAVTPEDVTVDDEAGTARAAGEFRGAMQLERVDGEWRVSVPAFID